MAAEQALLFELCLSRAVETSLAPKSCCPPSPHTSRGDFWEMHPHYAE